MKTIHLTAMLLCIAFCIQCKEKKQVNKQEAKYMLEHRHFSEYLTKFIDQQNYTTRSCFLGRTLIYDHLERMCETDYEEFAAYRSLVDSTVHELKALLDTIKKEEYSGGFDAAEGRYFLKHPEMDSEPFLFGDSLEIYIDDVATPRGNSAKLQFIADDYAKKSARLFTKLTTRLDESNSIKPELSRFYQGKDCRLLLHPFRMVTYGEDFIGKTWTWQYLLYEYADIGDVYSFISLLREQVYETERQGLLLVYMALLEEERLKSTAVK